MHDTSYHEMEKFAATLPGHPVRIADVGSANVNGTYKALFRKTGWSYIGLDMEAGRNVDIVVPGSGSWDNVPSDSFDIVVSGQVLEHVRDPWVIMREIARITKPGGRICVIAPFGWEHHRYPLDCWRIFPDGMETLFQHAGITVEKIYMVGNPEGSTLRGDTVGVGYKPMNERRE